MQASTLRQESSTHPAIKAASPQAPVADLFLNDDWYHGGAFMLAHTFDSAPVYQPQAEPTPPPKVTVPFDYGTNVRHEFFLKLGTLGNATRRRAWRCTRCRRCKTTFVSDCFA